MAQRHFELTAQVADARRLLRGAIRLLGWIVLQIVELRMRSLDELESSRTPGMQRGPPQLQLGVEGLGVRGSIRHWLAIGGASKRAAIDIAPLRKPRIVEERRQHVDRAGDGSRHTTRGNLRPRQDEGNSQRRVVQEDSVRALAMLAKALAMVGRDEHDRAAGLAPDVERLQQTPELTVHECDLSVVWRLTVPIGQVCDRWLVRRMRIVVMNPREPRSRLPSLPRAG